MRRLIFSFENSEVMGRFVDAVLAIPNMHGVTLTLEDALTESLEQADNTKQHHCLGDVFNHPGCKEQT